MFYQSHEVAEDEKVVEDDDVEADYLVADDVVPEPQPEPRR